MKLAAMTQVTVDAVVQGKRRRVAAGPPERVRARRMGQGGRAMTRPGR
jgi:hypothetical protein